MPIAVRKLALAQFLVLALSLPFAARADEVSHRAKANEMMAVLHTQRMVENFSQNLKKQIADAADKVAGPAPSDESKAKAANFEKKIDQLIDTQLSWDAMQGGFADIYIRSFTEEQLDGIIAFYKSPAGVALLETMPAVNSQATQFGNSQLTALQPQLKQLFEDFQKSEAAASAAPATEKSAPAPSATPTAPSKPK